MLRLTQAAVPLLELCDRLEDSPLHSILASSPELRTIVPGDLRTHLRQDATAAGYPRLASLLERLETRFPAPIRDWSRYGHRSVPFGGLAPGFSPVRKRSLLTYSPA